MLQLSYVRILLMGLEVVVGRVFIAVIAVSLLR